MVSIVAVPFSFTALRKYRRSLAIHNTPVEPVPMHVGDAPKLVAFDSGSVIVGGQSDVSGNTSEVCDSAAPDSTVYEHSGWSSLQCNHSVANTKTVQPAAAAITTAAVNIYPQ